MAKKKTEKARTPNGDHYNPRADAGHSPYTTLEPNVTGLEHLAPHVGSHAVPNNPPNGAPHRVSGGGVWHGDMSRHPGARNLQSEEFDRPAPVHAPKSLSPIFTELAKRGVQVGNPYDSPYVPDAVRAENNGRGVAAGHPNLNQSTTDLGPVVQVGSDRIAFTGQASFHNANSQSDAPGDAPGCKPRVQLYDARGQAGRLSRPLDGAQCLGDGTEAHATGRYGTARHSPTPANGSHDSGSQAGVQSNAVKQSPLDIMKAIQRRMG